MKKNIIILIIVIVIAAGAGFYGGMLFGKQSGTKAAASTTAARGSFGGARTRTAGAGFTNGQILSKTDNSLTIKLAAGGSEIVFLAPSSQIMKSATTTVTNLNIGDTVMVTGTTNSDGSVTAKTVQVGDFRLGGAARPATSTTGQGQAAPAQGQ
jgi:hypothetical protein